MEAVKSFGQPQEKRNPRNRRRLNHNRCCEKSRRHPSTRESEEIWRNKQKRLAEAEMLMEAEEYFSPEVSDDGNMGEYLLDLNLQDLLMHFSYDKLFHDILDEISLGDFSREDEARKMSFWIFMGIEDLNSAVEEGLRVLRDEAYDELYDRDVTA